MASLNNPIWRFIESYYGYLAPDPPPRSRDPNKPMQVLCVGLPRSGTESLQKALQVLGYDYTYHGWDMLNETPHRMNSWVALARRKYFERRSLPISAPEFDAVLGHSVAVTDAAANCFASDLIVAYPDAKVILNTRRNLDAWHASVMSNIVAVNEDWFKWLLCWFNADLWWMWHVHQRVLWPCLFRCSYWSLRGGVEPYGESIYELHSAIVRQLVPPERLLEWQIEDGWAPLCEFLGKDVPEDIPFPRANDAQGFKKRVEADLDALGLSALMNMAICVTLVVIGSVWFLLGSKTSAIVAPAIFSSRH